jgi:hypothetical protein
MIAALETVQVRIEELVPTAALTGMVTDEPGVVPAPLGATVTVPVVVVPGVRPAGFMVAVNVWPDELCCGCVVTTHPAAPVP